MAEIEEEEVRRSRLEALVAAGSDPYPAVTARSHTVAAFLDAYETAEAQGEGTPAFTLAGRVRTIRRHGGLTFLHLEDETGRVQGVLKRDQLGDTYAFFHAVADMGDFLEMCGTPFTTQKGEHSLLVASVRIIGKSLRPLPEKWHGLQDVETRYRQRELDLLSHPDVRQRFVARSRLVSAMRCFLDERGFLEVETPMLQAIPGGASARPFVTHHNALDVDLYLRIAPELYLKRLLVGGFEKIYEIGRCFRNEGIDYAHNPEFTMIELYWAYAGKEVFLTLLEDLVRYAVSEAKKGWHPEEEAGPTVDFASAWPRKTFRETILEACGIDIDAYRDSVSLVAAVREHGLDVDFSGCVGLGEHYDQLYKKTARAALEGPVWVFDYPVVLKPLTRRHPDDSTKSACAQLIIGGAEIINAYYHELNDPIDQRARFLDQQTLREQGSEEAQHFDEAFLTALEHGMPPAAGMGIGIDRLAALVTGAASLKEVILFPTLRPRPIEETSETV
ncbi:lysine--tRNA ligase [Candidatus Uhrbacteria bacterium]|nr:lysine--tRNA ligase [Candidatus Uhrbacteria bacterium]